MRVALVLPIVGVCLISLGCGGAPFLSYHDALDIREHERDELAALELSLAKAREALAETTALIEITAMI